MADQAASGGGRSLEPWHWHSYRDPHMLPLTCMTQGEGQVLIGATSDVQSILGSLIPGTGWPHFFLDLFI